MPSQIAQARLHRNLKAFLNKRQQGMVMGYYRQLLGGLELEDLLTAVVDSCRHVDQGVGYCIHCENTDYPLNHDPSCFVIICERLLENSNA